MKTLKSELIEKGLIKSSVKEDSEIIVQKYPKEKLSQRDLRELMGSNRDTYSRGRGGAIRSKRT